VSRPHKVRRVGHRPASEWFKPRGIPLRDLESVVLAVDELEALRLVDLEGLSHEAAGQSMGVSRGTIGRLVESGRRTAVDALVHGKALQIVGGGPVDEVAHAAALPCCEPGSKYRRGKP
jgi:predicted DNA-binding protein (UPF0251 family)